MNFHTKRICLTGLLLLFSSCPSYAQTAPANVIPFAAPTGFAIVPVAPDQDPGTSSVYDLYGAEPPGTPPTANWLVAQWNNSGPLHDFNQINTPDSPTGKAWQALGPDGYVLVEPGPTSSASPGASPGGTPPGLAGVKTPTVEIVANGRSLACSSATQSANEGNFLITPNNNDRSKAFPSARNSDNGGPNPSVASMATLTVNGTLDVNYFWTPPDPQFDCPTRQAAMMLGIVLSNPSHKQTLFYQFMFAKLAANGVSAPLTDVPLHATYYYEVPTTADGSGAYGVDDPITNSINIATDEPFSSLEMHSPTSISFDMLPQISKVISAGKVYSWNNNGLDTNLADWFISGMYYGVAFWGNVGVVSTWSGFLPMITPKSSPTPGE